MSDIVVKSGDNSETLKQKAEATVGGSVSITERAGGDRVVHLSQEQSKKLNKMSLEDRSAAFGGSVKQLLND